MEASTDADSPPLSAYALRQESDVRWQLIEPLPSDQDALQAELRRLDAKLVDLADGSESDFVKGCAILESKKRAFEEQARARYERLERSVAMLFDYESEQAHARYSLRCEQLKLDMSDEIKREIQRLRRARDGVAVMDRRRLTRHSGNTAGGGSNAGNGASGGSGDVGNDANGNGESSLSGLSVTEKRRMEVLLSATPIFRQLDKKLTSEDVAADVAMITEMMPTFLSGDVAAITELEDEDTDEEEARERDEWRDQIKNKRRRLVYRAGRVPEGLDVVVYRTASTPTKKPSQGRARSRESDNDVVQTELFSGVIASVTSSMVYVLAKDGSFQSFPVEDWKAGRISVHTVETTSEE